MQCKRDKNDASRYLADLMDERERLDYEAHLDECAECREELARYRRMLVMLGETPVEKAPLGLSRALDKAAEAHFGAAKPARPINIGRWAILRVAAAAVLVGAIITVAYVALRPDVQPPQDSEVAVKQTDADKDKPATTVSETCDEVADMPAALAPPERHVDLLAAEIDRPNEGYSDERMDVILSIAENTEVEEVLYLYNSRIGRSSNLAPDRESTDEDREAVPDTALQAAEQSARLKRLYAGAARQVQTTEQAGKLLEATENSQKNVLQQNQQIIEQQQAIPQAKSMRAFDAAGTEQKKDVKPDADALKKREQELVDALDEIEKDAPGVEPQPEPNEGDDKAKTEADAFEAAKREAIERELADVREKIQALQQQSTEAMPPPGADKNGDKDQAVPEEEKSTGGSYKETAPVKPEPQIVVRPIFRQTLVVQVAAGEAGDEKVVKIVESLKPLLAEMSAQMAEGRTIDKELTDAQIAELLVKLSRIGDLKLSLGPLEAGFVSEPPNRRSAESGIAGEADAERDDKPTTMLSLCVVRTAAAP